MSAAPATILDAKLQHMAGVLSRGVVRPQYGVVRESLGPILRVSLGNARIGDVCELVTPGHANALLAEVVAIRNEDALLCPYGTAVGLSAETRVISRGAPLTIGVGRQLLGRTIDAFGQPFDGAGFAASALELRPIRADTINPLERPLIDTVFPTGIRVIDGLLTLGVGQRTGIFGEPGAGKTTLLSMIARNASFDVCVIGLIGERGREVREFLDRRLPAEHRSRCVTVVSTSDRPPMERIIGAYSATTIAEYFRDQGLSVLLLIDSVTRFARALREVGLASGEVPARRGFPPSVFAELPRLIERSGPAGAGAITAIYTLLVEGGGAGDPLSEEVRSLTDGHIVLSAKQAQAGQFPAIDVLDSRSRVMADIIPEAQLQHAAQVRQLIGKYADIELLIQVGEYRPGADRLGDIAIRQNGPIREFCQQEVAHREDWGSTAERLAALTQ